MNFYQIANAYHHCDVARVLMGARESAAIRGYLRFWQDQAQMQERWTPTNLICIKANGHDQRIGNREGDLSISSSLGVRGTGCGHRHACRPSSPGIERLRL